MLRAASASWSWSRFSNRGVSFPPMSANLKTISTPPVRDRVSQEEWQMRVDLAAAYQLAAIFKWTDLIYTHFSARVPGTEDFLINPYGLMFDEITASTLVKIDSEGKIKDDPVGMGVNEAGFIIHSCMHAARPEINCVIHTHTRAAVAVSAMKCGLLPISQHAMRIQQEVQGHDPAQPRRARARRDRARGVRDHVLPRLRLPDPGRRDGRRPAQRAAHVGPGGGSLDRGASAPDAAGRAQGLASAPAHARAPRDQVRTVTGARPGSCSTVRIAAKVHANTM